MTYEQPWQFLEEVVPTDSSTLQRLCQSYLWQKYLAIQLAGWTQVAHNNWTSLTGLTWNTSTGARSWVLLKSPQGFVAGADGSYTGTQSQMYVCFECVGNSSADYGGMNFTFYTDPVGGTSTAIPTGGQSHATNGNLNGYPFFYSTLTTVRFHFAYTTAGAFSARVTRVGAGVVSSSYNLARLVSVGKIGALDYPYAALQTCAYAPYADTLSFNCFDAFGGPGNPSVTVRLFNADKSFGTPRACLLSSPFGTGFTLGSSLDKNGELIAQSILIGNAAVGHHHYIGRVADFYHVEFLSGMYRQVPTIGAKTHYNIGKMLVPGTVAPS